MSSDVRVLRSSVSSWAREVHTVALRSMPDAIRPYAPVRTGELRRSIRHVPAGGTGGSVIRGRVVAPVIQARTTDQGSPPHLIIPRRAGGLLVFYWQKAGRTVFLRRVNHPGNKAKPWWERALRATYRPALRHAAVTTPLR